MLQWTGVSFQIVKSNQPSGRRLLRLNGTNPLSTVPDLSTMDRPTRCSQPGTFSTSQHTSHTASTGFTFPSRKVTLEAPVFTILMKLDLQRAFFSSTALKLFETLHDPGNALEFRFFRKEC